MSHIRIENLGKNYLNRHSGRKRSETPRTSEDIVSVLNGINLECHDGEMVCILGPSGCGKSTLLRIVAGFDTPSMGNVFIDGKKVSAPSSDNIFVFQHSGLLPWMTVWQNVELSQRHMKDLEEKDKHIQEYIQMVELDGFEDYYPHQLSGGMQRRAELARALAVNPSMLIMDEPFSGLDFLTHMKMREEVVNMHAFLGKTILVVTHDIDDALIMGDRIVVLDDRPSRVILDRKLDFPHPRIFEKQPALSELRDELFLMLGVSYAV